MSKEPILKVKDLGISFSQYTNGLVRRDLNVIRNLDIELYEGEILAVVGSSGSGKSLLAHAILGILPDNACTQGDIIYKGEILDEKRKEKLGNAIYEICNGEILVLCDGYYDKKVGVVDEPNMELQML